MARKFRLDDEVLIVGNFDNSKNEIGDIGRIGEVEPDSYEGSLAYRVLVPGRSTSENWHAEQDLELITIKQAVMTDYKVAGTELPEVPDGTEYRAVNWNSIEPDTTFTGGYSKGKLISYGSKVYNDEVYILTDTRRYTGYNYYMIKESILLELERREKGEIIGYNLVKEEYREVAMKLATVPKFGSLDGSCDFKISSIAFDNIKAAGVLDLWFEPVYKKKETVIKDSQGREAKVYKNGLVVADGKLPIQDLEKIRDCVLFSTLTVGSNDWNVSLKSATFDIGCWKDVTLGDINLAIKAIESL